MRTKLFDLFQEGEYVATFNENEVRSWITDFDMEPKEIEPFFKLQVGETFCPDGINFYTRTK